MDNNEFTARMETLKARLYRTAYLYMGTESLALEAVDEAMYRAFLGLKKLRQPEFLETWVTRILLNECKKELRRTRRKKPLDDAALAALAETPDEAAAAALDALPLREAVLRLPAELKDVIILRYFSGFTLAQTAQSLDLPQGTVVTRQRRALAILRLEFAEEGQR